MGNKDEERGRAGEVHSLTVHEKVVIAVVDVEGTG